MAETREVIVTGTPRSLQGKGPGLNQWKVLVAQTATHDIGEEAHSIQFDDVAVHIIHFCPEWGDTDGDLDNIAKPILDALCDSHRVLFNDNQVKELLLRRIEWKTKSVTQIENATERLSASLDRAIRGEGPEEFVYIWVTTELLLEKLP